MNIQNRSFFLRRAVAGIGASYSVKIARLMTTFIVTPIVLQLYFDTFLPTFKSEPRKNGQNWRKSANFKQQCSAT